MSNSFEDFKNSSASPANSDNNNQLLLKLNNELNSGERLVWHEKATPGYFASTSISMFFFAIPWTAFAVFWMTMAYKESGDLLFTLFGTPFVLVGLWLLYSPVREYKILKQTIYGITSKRALILTKKNLKSFAPKDFKSYYQEGKKKWAWECFLLFRSAPNR